MPKQKKLTRGNPLHMIQIHICKDGSQAYVSFMRVKGLSNYTPRDVARVRRLVHTLTDIGYPSVTSRLDCGPTYVFLIEFPFWRI